MSHRPADLAPLYRCVRLALLVLAGCAPATVAGVQPPLPLRIVSDVPLEGNSRRFESQSLDAKTGMLFITDFAGGRVVVFDTKTNRVVKVIRDVPSAHGILAVPELRRVYVSEPGTYEIAVIDETTYEVVARVPGGRDPGGMAWDSVRGKLYVSDAIGESETVIDATTDRRVATIPLGVEAGDSQFDRSENLVYVNAKTTSELVAIDPALDAVVARYPLSECAENAGLLIDDAHRVAYVACRGSARIVTFDLRTHRQRAAYSACTGPDVLAWDAGTSVLYVACERGAVSMFHRAGGKLRKAAEGFLSDDARSVAVDSATHRAYFAIHDATGRPVIRVMLPPGIR